MSIEVHNPHVVNCLLADEERQSFRAYPTQSTTQCQNESGVNRAKTLPVPPSHQTAAAEKISTDDIEKECFKELMCNQRLYRQLTETENTLVKSLDALLIDSDEMHRNKYNVLFSKWDESIYQKLQSGINGKLNSETYKKLDSKKRRLFSRYLDTCNAKGTVFLDVISKEEYSPLSLSNISSTVPANKDPTKLSQTEDAMSTSIEQECGLRVSRSSRPVDRRGTCNEWINFPLRDVDSGVRLRSRQRMLDKTASSVPVEVVRRPKRKPALPSYNLNRPLSQLFF